MELFVLKIKYKENKKRKERKKKSKFYVVFEFYFKFQFEDFFKITVNFFVFFINRIEKYMEKIIRILNRI